MMMARVEFEWELNFYSGMKRVAAAMTTSTSSSLDVEIFFLFFFSFLIDAAVSRRLLLSFGGEEKSLKKSAGVEWEAGGRMMWFDKSTSLACGESIYARLYTRKKNA